MPALRHTQPGGGEAQLTDALREVIVDGGRVYALRDRRFAGSRGACAQLLDG
jgi:hypothetical protein